MSSQPWTVCLTFDFDALSVWLGGFAPVTPAMLSRGEYGSRVGVPRILQLLSTYGIPATFFVPGHTAESFPESVEAILTAGHEVAHHGYSHRDLSALNLDEERRELDMGLAALARFMDHPPLGYRSPSWDYSPMTVAMHPQVIGRGHRMALLERFIQHVLDCKSARLARMGDVARVLSSE